MGRVSYRVPTTGRWLRLIIGFIAIFAAQTQAENLAITQVNVAPQVLASNESTQIYFHINQQSSVVVKIYDGVDALVWRSEPMQLPAGSHAVTWNARDLRGEGVAPEAYYYTIEATAAGETVVYDLTDITGGEDIALQNLSYDKQKKTLKFTAAKTGRYLLRAGIAKAFAINTLVNNKVLIQGEYEIPWDGFDASHVLDASQHPQLQLGSFGYALSSNFIVVKPAKGKEAEFYYSRTWKSNNNPTEYRKKVTSVREGISPHFYRAVNQSRDVLLQVSLPDNTKKNKNGAYIFEGPLPLKINLQPEDVMVLEAQRGEIVLFLDNQLIHDNEVSYYPYTFTWGPQIYDGKEHLLTAFVAGFAGNIGIATLKVQFGQKTP